MHLATLAMYGACNAGACRKEQEGARKKATMGFNDLSVI